MKPKRGGFSRSSGLASGSAEIKVSNLHYDITESDLNEEFSKHGRVR